MYNRSKHLTAKCWVIGYKDVKCITCTIRINIEEGDVMFYYIKWENTWGTYHVMLFAEQTENSPLWHLKGTYLSQIKACFIL